MSWFDSHHAARRRRTVRQMDEIAERVAEGMSVGAAARSMGLSQQRGSQLWVKIRNGLGVPAKD